MIYDSPWANTLTFYPLLHDYLSWRRNNLRDAGRALMIGASDEKFVFPLLDRVQQVTAVDQDNEALDRPQTGLRHKVRDQNVEERVDVKHVNFIDYTAEESFDVVFTSCSWHYSLNKGRIHTASFIEKMKSSLGQNGVFCAEYMMPSEEWHHGCERYLKEGDMKRLFEGWNIVYNFYTDIFDEAPHPGKETWHQHKMGFFLATK